LLNKFVWAVAYATAYLSVDVATKLI